MYLLYIYSRHHDFRNMQWRVAKFIHEIHFVYVYYLIININELLLKSSTPRNLEHCGNPKNEKLLKSS